jgi:hypothetical protein
MRAVKGSLGHSPKFKVGKIERPSLGLRARLGVPVGGRVRKSRAVEDQSAPIPEETTSELGMIIYIVRHAQSRIDQAILREQMDEKPERT